ncbi:MAG: hypothetical protein MJE68_18760 [Proteobacteria bacterium]|nr:hypothetical protein [Pseudomonadota bacterium]
MMGDEFFDAVDWEENFKIKEMNLLDEIGELKQTLNVERRRNDLERENLQAERQQLRSSSTNLSGREVS